MSMQDQMQPEPSKPGMSSTAKVLLILGGIGGLCLLVCCGVGGYFVYKGRELVANATTTDPEAIRTRAQQIAPGIQVLSDLEPMQALDLVVMKWVIYQRKPQQDGMLMLMEFDTSMFQQGDPEQQRKQMLDAMRQQQAQSGQMDANLQIQERTSRDLTVRGQTTKFEFNKGTAGGKTVRQVIGSFPSPKGVAMLMLMLPDEGYEEEAVVRMIESIRDSN
ncbi:MAG: hypothetical protein ACKV0T_23115 [Planctomycetales bacterium]